MKKERFLKFVFLLLSVCLILYNCQKDEVEIITQKEAKYKIATIDINKVSKNTKLITTLKKIKHQLKEHQVSKEIASTKYNFTVDTNYAKYIENREATYHSYTFQIRREQESEILENLLVSLQPDGTYKLFLVKYYNLKETEKEQIRKEESIEFRKNDIEYEEIFDSTLSDTLNSQRTVYGPHNSNCTALLVPYCYENICDGGAKCTARDWKFVYICHHYGDDGDSSDGGVPNYNPDANHSSGGGGSTGSDTNNDTEQNITNPIIIDKCPDGQIKDANGYCIEDPCESIKDLMASNANISQRFKELYGKKGVKNESGFEIYHDNATKRTRASDAVKTSDNTNSIRFNFTKYTVAVAHNHPDLSSDADPFFSGEDIFDLAKLANNYQGDDKDRQTIYTIFLNVFGTTYALKFIDKTSMNNLKELFKDPKEIEELIDDVSKAYYKNKKRGGNIEGDKEALLNLLSKKYNIHLNVLKAEHETDGTIKNWKVFNNTSKTYSPCN